MLKWPCIGVFFFFNRRCNHDPTHRVCAKIGLPNTSFWIFTGQTSWCGTISKWNFVHYQLGFILDQNVTLAYSEGNSWAARVTVFQLVYSGPLFYRSLRRILVAPPIRMPGYVSLSGLGNSGKRLRCCWLDRGCWRDAMGKSMTFVSFYYGKIGFETMGLRELSPLGMGSN